MLQIVQEWEEVEVCMVGRVVVEEVEGVGEGRGEEVFVEEVEGVEVCMVGRLVVEGVEGVG